MSLRALVLGVFLSFEMVLVGCTSQTVDTAPTASPTLVAYRSPTATQLPPPAQTRPVVSVGASPTPFVHEVVEGDTLLGIAIRYGVGLDELLAANPEIDPRFLSVGQPIRIPGPDGAAPETILPTSTPISIPVRTPVCYLSVSGGSVCFALIENPGEGTIEGLTAQISLLSPQGSSLASQLAYPPLNLLEPGGRMPLVAHFPDKEIGPSGAQATLLSAVAAVDLEGRYAAVEIDAVEIQIQPELAQVSFEIHNPVSNDLPISAVVVAIAYDASGQVVGYRKWESEAALAVGGTLQGSLEVASLGPGIDQVEVLAEARPVVLDNQ